MKKKEKRFSAHLLLIFTVVCVFLFSFVVSSFAAELGEEGVTGDEVTTENNEDTTDEGTSDEGTTDEGTTDEGTSDEGTTDEGTTDEGTTDEGTTDEGTTDEGTSDEGTSDDPVLIRMGDLDGDGNVDVGEARKVLRVAVSLETLEAEELVYADVNGDGTIGVADARQVLRISVGLTTAEAHLFEVTVVTTANCTEDGLMQYTCSACDLTGEIVLASMGHSYTETERVDADCLNGGFATYECDVCGETKEETFSATGHKYEVTKRVEPTCTQAGSLETTCKNCGNKTTGTIRAPGHNMIPCTATVPQHCDRCNEKYTGWQQSATGKYYYYSKSGNTYTCAKNQIVGSYYVGPDGVRVDDAAINAAVNFVNSVSSSSASTYSRLQTCYEYLYLYFDYKTNPDITATPDGRFLPGYCTQMFEERGGNCFRFASAFAYIARVLGLDSGIAGGQISATGGGTTEHGLTEVYYNGTTYWCDAMMQWKYNNYNSFMVTASSYPYGYTKTYQIKMTVSNGEVIWK